MAIAEVFWNGRSQAVRLPKEFRVAATFAALYLRFADFQALRRRLDLDGRFRNAHLDRLRGPA